MANKYAVASGSWSSTGTWSDTDGGASGATVPADDDAVFILINVSVLMDVDQSAFTGLRTVTIRGHATTPAMLYWANGTDGYLKVRSTYSIVGTSGAAKGRLLVNSNGTWGGTTPLQNSNKATIALEGTATINAQYLDIALYGTEPTNKSVRTYATKYDFNGATAVEPSTDVIDLGTTPPTGGTAVMVTTSGGTLPTPLVEETIYYVRSVSGNTCKLASRNSDATIIDITADGSGTCSLITGHTNTGTAVMNVLEDVTADGPWTTTDGWDRVVLVSHNESGYDQQRAQLTTIAAGALTLSANVDSTQSPGARIWLASRNVQVLSSTTGSPNVIDYSSATTSGGVFACAIISTAGSGTTHYGIGTSSGTGHTISGIVSGFSTGISTGAGHTVSGTVAGCSTGIGTGTGHTVSGTVAGCSTGISAGAGHTMSGTVAGCSTGISTGAGHTMSGTVSGSITGINGGTGHTISGVITGCNLGTSSGTGHTITGAVVGCGNGISTGVGHVVVGVGAIGFRSDGSACANTNDFVCPLHVILRGAKYPSSPAFNNRNAAGTAGDALVSGVYSEDDGRTLGASKAWLGFGTVTKQTSVIRTGGASSALQVDPLSACANYGGTRILIFEWTELSVPASSQTRSVYMRGFGWASWPTSSELWFEAEWISNATTFARTTTKSTDVLSDNTTWVQFDVTFTPAAAGHVRYRAWLAKYAASSGVYVDAQLN